MNGNPHAQLPYPCNTILFRAIIFDSLLRKNGEHKPNIFYRRENSDPHGISLVSTIQGCKDAVEDPIFGVRSLHVGLLYDLPSGLWLFPDEDSPSHANLCYRDGQLTPRLVDDAPECRNLANDLMTISRPIDYWDEPDADERFARELEAKREARQAAGQ